MTINTQKLRERIDAAIKRITSGSAPMRVPAENTDPDLVLADAKTALEAQAAEIAHRKSMFDLVANSVCAALERAGVEAVDDPGEAIDVLVADKDREIARLRSEFDRANDALAAIGDFAHSKSTGPATPDALWEVRAMAYDAVRIPEDIDDMHTGNQP